MASKCVSLWGREVEFLEVVGVCVGGGGGGIRSRSVGQRYKP